MPALRGLKWRQIEMKHEPVTVNREKVVTVMSGWVWLPIEEHNVVDLDAERKAGMVSNLMVVLCGESEVHPVVNTGTLYH